MISLLLYESSMLSAVGEFARRTYRSSAQIRFLLARVCRGTLHFWTPSPRNTGCSPADKPRGGDVQLRRSYRLFLLRRLSSAALCRLDSRLSLVYFSPPLLLPRLQVFSLMTHDQTRVQLRLSRNGLFGLKWLPSLHLLRGHSVNRCNH